MLEALSTSVETKPLENMVSKRLINRIFEVLRPYGFSREWIEQGLAAIEIEDFSLDEAGRINAHLPFILEALFSKNHGFEQVDIHRLGDFLKSLVRKISNHETFEDLFLTIGMGGTTVMPSIRLPAYLASALHSLLAFQHLNAQKIIQGSPTLRVFKADHFASKINDFELEKVLHVSKQTFLFLSDFIDYFFPELKQKIVLESDNNWMNDPEKAELQDLHTVARAIQSTSGEIRTEVDSLMRMGQKHGGERGAQNAFLYAAAHPFYNQSLMATHNRMFDSFATTHPVIVIDHGGRPQATFNKIVNSVRGSETLLPYQQPICADVIVPAGKVPVYYRAREYDFGIDEDPKNFDMSKIDRLTKNDYRAIDQLVGLENYFRFLNERFEKARGVSEM